MAMPALDFSRPSRRANPFSADHASYRAFDDHDPLHRAFRDFIVDPTFACVAAKSAIRNGSYRVGTYGAMPEAAESDDAEALAHDLFEFVVEQPSFTGFSTFVATFADPASVDEHEFERRLWAALQCLHDLDVVKWDPTVSSDPASPDFSFSFAGRAFFIVGLHPNSSRLTRRFAYPAIVFNSHEQFETLRKEGKFERMQAVIRARDIALQGDTNANLAAYGERSEALQYSGRPVEATWRCPFHKKNA